MKMKFAGLVMLLGIVVASCHKNSNSNNGSTVNATDRNFVVQASYSNRDEIAAGNIASSRGSRDSVKMFGQMMVNDHTMAESSLDSLASTISITTPTGPDSLHMVMGQQLMLLTGKAFDSVYLNSQVKDHQNTIALFQNEISSGSNTQVKNFATKNLPVIQMHYNMAVQLAATK